jgi:hypothetical protein
VEVISYCFHSTLFCFMFRTGLFLVGVLIFFVARLLDGLYIRYRHECIQIWRFSLYLSMEHGSWEVGLVYSLFIEIP